MSIRLVKAPLKIAFSRADKDRYKLFKREFDKLSEYDEDPVGQWLKMAKARGETKESDQVLLTLIVELHRKVDEITKILKNEEIEFLKLDTESMIEEIGFEHFKIEDDLLEEGLQYYGRIPMPIFPKREVAVFFTAVSENIAKIDLMHERDRVDWDAYVAARERVMIRERKAKR
ncbi:MAG: hypothetical protein GXO31_05295 [Epsilonproteobacteria bacterium]|nr:hypothetical protein [Campylobacterota bacterium]